MTARARQRTPASPKWPSSLSPRPVKDRTAWRGGTRCHPVGVNEFVRLVHPGLWNMTPLGSAPSRMSPRIAQAAFARAGFQVLPAAVSQ